MNEKRDREILDEYQQDGRDVRELARIHNLCARRITQILKAGGVKVERRKRPKKPISSVHERLGRMLADHRYDHDLDLYEAANNLGVTVIRFRQIEKGIADLEILELMDLASFLGRSISELLGEKQ